MKNHYLCIIFCHTEFAKKGNDGSAYVCFRAYWCACGLPRRIRARIFTNFTENILFIEPCLMMDKGFGWDNVIFFIIFFVLSLSYIIFAYKNIMMEVINLSETNSIVSQYLAEIRDVDYQKNRLLFRNNIMRIGEFEAFEISKTLDYAPSKVTTPLGEAILNVPTDEIVLATIFRAGLPFHNGFLHVYDHAGNAFVSAYREYTDVAHSEVGIHVEYLATPSIEGKNLIIADPMLATGGSMELGYKAFLTKGTPKRIHVACVIATPEGIEHVRNSFPEENTTIWCAAIDPGMNEHKYIVPGFGDAGDLCFGDKI